MLAKRKRISTKFIASIRSHRIDLSSSFISFIISFDLSSFVLPLFIPLPLALFLFLFLLLFFYSLFWFISPKEAQRKLRSLHAFEYTRFAAQPEPNIANLKHKEGKKERNKNRNRNKKCQSICVLQTVNRK